MPKPPLITSPAGQRLAVALMMGAILAASLGAAYAFAATRSQRAAQDVPYDDNLFAFAMPAGWEAHDPGPLTQILTDPSLYRDTARPTRLLAVGKLTTPQPTPPQEEAQKLAAKLAPGATPHALFSRTVGGVSHVELCVRRVERGAVVQQLFAVVTRRDEPTHHAVFYLEDVVADEGTFQQNQMLFRHIHESIVFP